MEPEKMHGGELIGLAADLVGVAGIALDLAVLLNQMVTDAPDPPDRMMVALNKVHAALNSIDDFALASWVTAREDNLAFLLAHSSSALQTTNAFLQSGASRSDPDWSARLALAERDSLIAVQTFTGDLEGGFWLRPESIKAISWAGPPGTWMFLIDDHAEKHSFNRVWDHRWALPAAVYTISARVAVLKASGVDAAVARNEIEHHNEFIARTFQKMESGVKSLDALDDRHIRNIPTQGVPIVAADIYGGYFVGGHFDPMFNPVDFNRTPFPPSLDTLPLPAELIIPGGTLEGNLKNHELLTRYLRNYVSQKIGLPGLLRFSGRLENLLAT